MKSITVLLIASVFSMVLLSCGTESEGAPANTDLLNPLSEKLSKEFAFQSIKQNHHYGFATSWWFNDYSDLFYKDKYAEYLDYFKSLENEGLVTLELTYDGMYIRPHNVAKVQLTEYGIEAYGGNSKGKVIIGSEFPDKILGIVHSNSGTEADVKFSVRFEDSPFLKLAQKRSVDGYESQKVPHRKAHFVKYDTGWQLETIDDEPISEYLEIAV